jgi:hypothetical protein
MVKKVLKKTETMYINGSYQGKLSYWSDMSVGCQLPLSVVNSAVVDAMGL